MLPDSPPRFVNLNAYLWSERWLERYEDMDFIQSVLNGWPAVVRALMPCATLGRIWIRTTINSSSSSGIFIRE